MFDIPVSDNAWLSDAERHGFFDGSWSGGSPFVVEDGRSSHALTVMVHARRAGRVTAWRHTGGDTDDGECADCLAYAFDLGTLPFDAHQVRPDPARSGGPLCRSCGHGIEVAP